MFRVSQDRGDKLHQAALEACRLKRCIGALRYLWRNAKSTSHHESVAQMKAELVESPQAAARKIAKEQASDNESNLPLASEDDAASVAPVANGDEEVVDEADRDEDVGENGVDCGVARLSFRHSFLMFSVCRCVWVCHSQKSLDMPLASPEASDADSLHAPTLRLGVDTEPIEVNSDSQGSEPVWPQTGDREGLIKKWLEEIEMFLKESGNLQRVC